MLTAAQMTANYTVTMYCARHADQHQTAYHSRIDGCLDTLIDPPSRAYLANFAAQQRAALAQRQLDRAV